MIRVKGLPEKLVYTCRCGASYGRSGSTALSRRCLHQTQPGVVRVETSGPGFQPIKDASELVTDLPTLRFAIAAFDTWAEVQKALQVLNAGGKALNDVSYLARQRVLADAVTSNGRQTVHLFGGTDGGIGCSAGPVADRLAGRFASGATTIKVALGRWLIPRHAAHLQQAVEEGKILLWVQLFDNDDERRAYQSLLATSSHSVGVHDLVGP